VWKWEKAEVEMVEVSLRIEFVEVISVFSALMVHFFSLM
jgi:hypothetical protein